MGALPIIYAAGTGFQIVTTLMQGSAARAQAEAQARAARGTADLLDYNASVADIQAEDALARGAVEESQYRAMVRGAVGTQRAGYAGQNIEVSSGSALDIQADATLLGELDSRQIRQNAMREAWGYQVEAYDTRKRAAIMRREGVMIAETGRAAQQTAQFAALGQAAQAGGSYFLTRYGFKQATAVPPAPEPLKNPSLVFQGGTIGL